MIAFERVSKYPDAVIPTRGTTYSAGYDFTVAEDTMIPSYYNTIKKKWDLESFNVNHEFTLADIQCINKALETKPTLVPTGIKCELEPDTYLELSVRSSTPLKHWIIMANGVGIIDADYYNNPDNEGHIYFQLINLSPLDIYLKKGDKIGQGIIKHYLTADDDNATGERAGGFGSTSK